MYGKIVDGYLVSYNTKLEEELLPLETFQDSDGNYYKYYNQDGTPDLDRIEAEESLAIITKTNNEALQYLTSTDWYITRQVETGVEVPQEIIDERATARESIVSV